MSRSFFKPWTWRSRPSLIERLAPNIDLYMGALRNIHPGATATVGSMFSTLRSPAAGLLLIEYGLERGWQRTPELSTLVGDLYTLVQKDQNTHAKRRRMRKRSLPALIGGPLIALASYLPLATPYTSFGSMAAGAETSKLEQRLETDAGDEAKRGIETAFTVKVTLPEQYVMRAGDSMTSIVREREGLEGASLQERVDELCSRNGYLTAGQLKDRYGIEYPHGDYLADVPGNCNRIETGTEVVTGRTYTTNATSELPVGEQERESKRTGGRERWASIQGIIAGTAATVAGAVGYVRSHMMPFGRVDTRAGTIDPPELPPPPLDDPPFTGIQARAYVRFVEAYAAAGRDMRRTLNTLEENLLYVSNELAERFVEHLEGTGEGPEEAEGE